MSKKRLYKGEFLQRKDPKSTASGYHAPPDKRSSHHAPSDKRSSHHAPSVRRSRHHAPPTRRIPPYLQQLSHVRPAQLSAQLCATLPTRLTWPSRAQLCAALPARLA
ncbi:hypothetical protein M6B38_172635 [Iris pallida]|uniref:Uncharacterized protein n=1 Tax=Iris pallida TaxID=29817 RepID=A0AAX6ESY5_IRIPA|nr:hypothetical protein M6B38_172635 [Iris pallida]